MNHNNLISFQTPRRGRIKFGGDHDDDIDIQHSDRVATIENPIAEQSRTSSRFRPRALTSTTGRPSITTKSSAVEPETTTKRFQRSRTSKKNNEQPERKPSSRQARTFTSRSTDAATSIANTPLPTNIPVASPPKFNGGRRRIEKTATATTKEPVIADIEQENYPQHFKEHVKSKQPYQPKIKNRPAYQKSSTTTTTTSTGRPQAVEAASQSPSPRKSLFKPRVKVEKPKVTTSSTSTTTSRTTRSAVRSKVLFPQRPDIEKSTADNEILNNIPTEGQFLTTRNRFSAKFSTESPVSRKNEDVLRNVSL